MNIDKCTVPKETFEFLRDFIFDDSRIVDEDYAEHSDTNVSIIGELTTSSLNELCNQIRAKGLDMGNLKGKMPTLLIGTWMAYCSKGYNDGIRTEEIEEFFQVHEVTETIQITKWKPIECPSIKQ